MQTEKVLKQKIVQFFSTLFLKDKKLINMKRLELK